MRMKSEEIAWRIGEFMGAWSQELEEEKRKNSKRNVNSKSGDKKTENNSDGTMSQNKWVGEGQEKISMNGWKGREEWRDSK